MPTTVTRDGWVAVALDPPARAVGVYAETLAGIVACLADVQDSASTSRSGYRRHSTGALT